MSPEIREQYEKVIHDKVVSLNTNNVKEMKSSLENLTEPSKDQKILYNFLLDELSFRENEGEEDE